MALNPKPSRPHFFSQTPESLAELVKGWGMPAFRAKQIMQWVYEKGIADPALMTNLGPKDRELLAEKMAFVEGATLRHLAATDGTQKLLIDWGLSEDEIAREALLPIAGQPLGDTKNQTETVMIPSESRESGKLRRTACVSSQMGCPVGCKFCASGLSGLDGNLTNGQIVQQIWMLSRLPAVERISNVVFMGMGEPLSNFNNVVNAAKTMMAPWGLGISARKITISTVGMPSPIRKLADMDFPITLAISLHAPNDEIRRKIIPWAEFVTVEQLIEAGAYYFEKTGREVTLEYILLSGVNDLPEHARELAVVARRLRSNINLIRYNEVKGMPFIRPTDEAVLTFQQILTDAGISTHIRASRGRDIAAACGQLRHENAKKSC